MTFKELNVNYILNDGKIVSLLMNFTHEPSVSIILKVREIVDSKRNDAELKLEFSEIISCEIFEDFKTEHYSDITFLELENNEYYLSLDPYSNLNIPNEEDNFIIKSKKLQILKT